MSYTALVIVEQVTEATRDKVGDYGKVTTGTPRVGSEVAKIVVRGDTLDVLKEKITAHVALV